MGLAGWSCWVWPWKWGSPGPGPEGSRSTLSRRKQTPGLGKASTQGQWATDVCEGSLFSLWLLHSFPGENGSLEINICEWKWEVTKAIPKYGWWMVLKRTGRRRVVFHMANTWDKKFSTTARHSLCATVLPLRVSSEPHEPPQRCWDAAQFVFQKRTPRITG